MVQYCITACTALPLRATAANGTLLFSLRAIFVATTGTLLLSFSFVRWQDEGRDRNV